MAATVAVYLCQFCSKEFQQRSILFEHLMICEKNSLRQVSNIQTTIVVPKLCQNQQEIFESVRLRKKNKEKQVRSSLINVELIENFQIPLVKFGLNGKFSSLTDSLSSENFSSSDQTTFEENPSTSSLTNSNKLSSYHIYKYSRRERRQFNVRLQRLALRKNCQSNKVNRTQNDCSAVFNAKHHIIEIPTKISSRQRLSSSNNRYFPLIFDNYFHELVKMPTNSIFNRYLDEMHRYFHLIHSIASQEFQYLVVNHDQQQETSFTNYSLMNILRQTFLDSNSNFKRRFYQTFQDSDHNSHSEQEMTINSEQDLFIPPLKIRRYDHSSYEIQNRSGSSATSSASSGVSITQINQTQNQSSSSEDRRQSETRSKQFSTKSCDQQINSNSSFNSDLEKKDLSNHPIEPNFHHEQTIIDQHSQSMNENSKQTSISSSNSFMRKTNSPTVISDLANDNLPKYQSVALNDGARIRIVNCSNDNSKNISHRNSNPNVNKRSSQLIDENWKSKNGRNNRKASMMAQFGANSKSQPVILTNSEISHGWLTHAVFYRCHACLHEEFFVVLSRECMNLHISSKHANMEENFKQRVSNFLNNQGRALKIFQHYLKWQQPWPENEIDQIFQLSNVNTRTNGTL